MSSVKISGNASGTGILTIAAPNTNTDRTLTLPDEDGAVLVNGQTANVGFGTATPSYLVSANSAAPQIGCMVSGTDALRVAADGTQGYIFEPRNLPLSFATNATERIRIDATGNLLVSRTSTGETAATAGHNIYESGVYYQYAPSTQVHRYYNTSNQAQVGSISITTTATAYNTSSDYRLKEDWQPVANASTRVEALKPVNFAWKADGSRVDGFLAHELAEVVPEAVTGEKDAVDAEGNPEYQGIDQSKLVPLLTAALQEALGEIKDLKARVAVLEGGA